MKFVQKALFLSFLSALLLVPAGVQAQQVEPGVAPVTPGDPFPAASFANLNQQGGGPATVDLAASLGKKPIALVYWIPGNPRADQVLKDIEALIAELGDEKIDLYAVTFPRPDRGEGEAAKQAAELKLGIPVLADVGFRVGQQLRIQSAPNVSIIDKSGNLRLTNGASLTQALGYKQDLESALRRVASEGTLGTYGYLDKYYPVNELVGKKCPEFKAPLITSMVEQRWTTMLKNDKVNVLIFWSVDCPHCRKSLPAINGWLRDNADGLNVISAARVTDDALKLRTREFCDLNQFVFPTLVDMDLEISNLYQITSTPTILIIRPDGVVDSVVISGHEDIEKKLLEAKRTLLAQRS